MPRIIELKWNCNSCDSKNILGRHKVCPQCGSPRESGEMNMSGLESSKKGYNPAPTVIEPELLDLAHAGYDWFCPSCGSGNRGDRSRCTSCAYTAVEEVAPETRNTNTPTHTTPKPNTQRRVEYINTSDYNSTYNPAVVAPLGAVALSLIILVFVILGTWWLLTTREVDAIVTSTHWIHNVQVFDWRPHTVREWKHRATETRMVEPRNGQGERPGMRNIGYCRSEHYDDERYVCGTREICKDVYRTERESYSCSKEVSYVCGEVCRDMGNGFASCDDKYCSKSVPDTCYRSKEVFSHKDCHDENKYCTRPIMRDKCDYEVYGWVKGKLHSEWGNGTSTRWPSVELLTDQKSVRSAEYEIIFRYDGQKAYKHTISSESTYKRFVERGKAKLNVDRMGFVHSVVP